MLSVEYSKEYFFWLNKPQHSKIFYITFYIRKLQCQFKFLCPYKGYWYGRRRQFYIVRTKILTINCIKRWHFDNTKKMMNIIMGDNCRRQCYCEYRCYSKLQNKIHTQCEMLKSGVVWRGKIIKELINKAIETHM